MRNPWLDIPLADYEGHMALAQVAQAQLLADVFGDALKEHSPRSVAVIGCAGGNGFEKIDPGITSRVVGIDINPEYLAQARFRFHGRFQTLELYQADIQTDRVDIIPVDLVFAALVFEYVDIAASLNTVRSALNSGGVLVSLVQLPSPGKGAVTPSPFKSIQALEPCMRLVPPKVLSKRAVSQGFEPGQFRLVDSPGGKQFHIQSFRAKTSNHPKWLA